MKRMIFLWVCCIYGLFSWSQSPYLPFVEEGKTWRIEKNMPPSPDTVTYVLRGDTLIDGVKAKRLYSYSRHFYPHTARYECALLEKDRKVMCIPRNSRQPTLLYQFAEPGTDLGVHPVVWAGRIEHVHHPEFDENTPLRVRLKSESWSYIENNGIRRIVQTIVSEETNHDPYPGKWKWVEGIGFLYGPCTMHIPMGVTGYYGARLLSLTVGDRIDYNVTGVAPPTAIPTAREVLHDLGGRRLSAPPQRGIYLRNGKKMVR